MRPVGEVRVPADHPCLAGHFPGAPVIPGVLLLDAIAGLILPHCPGMRLSAVPLARFLAPVGPGDSVAIAAALPEPGDITAPLRVAFLGTVEGRPVVKGSLALGPCA